MTKDIGDKMNFEEKLNQFVERGADRRSKMQNSSGCEHMDKAISRLLKIGYDDCGASLKPIVLKLCNDLHECKAILMRQWGSEEKIRSLTGPPLEIIILDALAEVEKILEGEKND